MATAEPNQPPRTSICVFAIDRILIGLRLGEIDRVLAAMQLHQPAMMPPYFAGFLNLHGALIPVVEIRKLLGLPAKALAADDRIVLGRAWGESIAFVVDAVLGVQDYEVLQVIAPALQPAELNSSVEGFVLHGRDLIMIHELEKFLTAEVAAHVKSLKAADVQEKEAT
jgi:chemotaxis signal transduction protein